MSQFTKKQIEESRAAAIEKIKKILDTPDVEKQFTDITGSYYSSDKFIVSWNANYKGMPCEFSIDKTDSFYKAFSGFGAIYAVRNFVFEKQLDGYHSIERALIEIGLKLVGKNEKREFFLKYAIPYNERIKKPNPVL